jgi:hypothetical protein
MPHSVAQCARMVSPGELAKQCRGVPRRVVVCSLFGWLVADGWCWFVLREEYCWLVAGGWFIVREKYCWLVADKPSEQGGGFSFDPGACKCQCIKCPCRGSRYGGGGPVMPSSETETFSRGRSALDRDGASLEGSSSPERGGISLEGASGPRARWNFTRGGDQPSSEARLYRCGAVPLERSGVSPEGG